MRLVNQMVMAPQMPQVIVLTPLAQFKADYPTKKQANKPALAAQYSVRQVVTFFHDTAH